MFFGILNNIFTNIKDFYDLFIDNNIIQSKKSCLGCNNFAELSLFRKGAKKQFSIDAKCRDVEKKSLINSELNNSSLIHIFLIMSGSNYQQLYWCHKIFNATIASIRKKLLKCHKIFLSDIPIFLGDSEIIIEADETVISCR
ncbi:hypothetical protein DMUE_3602 [Dictyocoela muelleri]|nr:hypothetical protein DMUE_3602 [Dictyocoela muelleri]